MRWIICVVWVLYVVLGALLLAETILLRKS
jgi:hypothetical protein